MRVTKAVGATKTWWGAALMVMLCLMPTPSRAYVLMGEHVLDLMVKALGQAETVEVNQVLTIHADRLPLPISPLEETVRIRFPYDLRADATGDGYRRQTVISGRMALLAVNAVLQEGAPPRYTRYHEILMAKPRQALTDHLRMLGIDVTVSSLGRLEDRYCYVVGARYPDETPPQLWVEKDTFHPLRLILPPSTRLTDGGPVEIRYRNWALMDGIAYPMHIVMRQNHQIMQEIRVDKLQVNPVFTPDVFDITALRREWTQPVEGEGRRVIDRPGSTDPIPVETDKKN